MKTHNFRLILADAADVVDDMTQTKFVELANALYEAGCDDGSPEVCQGKVAIDFHRDAATLEDAIRSAIKDVARAGYRVERHVEVRKAAVKEGPSSGDPVAG